MTMLKKVLRINAVSSGVTGLGLVAIPGLIANLFDATQTTPFVMTGIFLVAFAAFVFFIGSKNSLREGPVRLITALDILWVIGSLVIVIFQLFALSTVGYVLIFAIAMWVGLMAFLQYTNLKQSLT